MSLNKFMHPRNLYKIPPNFKELAIYYPEFRQFAKQDLSGKIRLDFKDANALRVLTRTLLLKDFNLEVEIPPDRLVPTLPLRLNYLLWLDDIVKQNGFCNEIKGIDIGTGASCVYPLLAARHFKWHMLGSEVDSKSFEVARKNVDNNQLQDVITLRKVDGEKVLCSVIDPDVTYTFCMCNPPFFSSEDELVPETVSRNLNRPRPRNAASGAVSELVSQGGECVFIQKIIDDSNKLKSQIRIYTVMVGHKSSITTVREYLKQSGITNISTTEFCQGHTTRWGIAWTHDAGITLITDSPTSSAKKNKTPFSFVLPKTLPLTEIVDKVRDILSELQIKIKVMKTNNEFCAMEITAEVNKWSNQRRKRRLKHQQQLKCSPETTRPECDNHKNAEGINSENSVNDKSVIQVNQFRNAEVCLDRMPGSNTQLLDSCTSSGVDDKLEISRTVDNKSKNLKRSVEQVANKESVKRIKLESEDIEIVKTNNNGPLLVGSLVVRGVSKTYVFELFYLRGTGGRDSAHQVLQYLKNKFML